MMKRKYDKEINIFRVSQSGRRSLHHVLSTALSDHIAELKRSNLLHTENKR